MSSDLGEPHRDAKYEKLDLARRRVLSSARKLREIKLTMLQAEMIDRLIDGRRTATELVWEIFVSRPGDEGFEAYYSKVRRDLRDLERRGYASTGLFGRDKPYRLTSHGIAVILSVVPDIGEVRLIQRKELASFSVTASAGIILWIVRGATDPAYTIVLGTFFTSLGVSLTAFARVLRRVA